MKNKIILLLAFLCFSSSLKAQTGGPGQPEFMQFKPATASDLVNPSTGTFSYNIPLFDVGGYPVNLSYSSGISMEDVASIVGLGWNINIGAITHTMRGLPDDFKGDPVVRTIYMKPNTTFGANMDIGAEIAGFGLGAGFDMGFGIFYNNYLGFGAEQSIGFSLSMHKEGNPGTASIGLGMKANSQSGVDLYAQPSVSMQMSSSSNISANGSLGGMISINSREGLKESINASMSLSANFDEAKTVKDSKGIESSVKVDPISESIASASASYSFSKTPEIPRINYPFKSDAYSASFKAGAEVFFTHPHGEMKGYYTSQSLSTNLIITPAYGFLYSDQAPSNSDNVLLDFNREKDQPYIKDASINIGVPFYTNDIYSVNAQGISGSFQLNRSDIGVIFDNHVATANDSKNLGIEAGFGNATHVGADLSSTTSSANSGKWYSDITYDLGFRSQLPDYLYQPAYFKNASDVSVDENYFFEKLNGDKAVKVEIQDASSLNTGTNHILINDNGGSISTNNPNIFIKTIRDPRTINIQYKTAELAAYFGLDKPITEFPVNDFSCNSHKIINSRVAGNTDWPNGAVRQPHHISEITSTNTDGMRYVFGLPTYNTKQKEVSFTLDKSQIPGNDGLVDCQNHSDWGTNGKDGFYESTELPPYVTSHLLTAVLSPDYIDVDNNGPSLNDVGNYVKINYSYAGIYKWRTPYGANKGTFNKAFLSDSTDNKASYVYGEKELWYTHSIESKTEVAEFYYDTKNRKDGFGVVSESGGKFLGKKLYKLDSIKVYSINERVLKGNAAVPIRIIHFDYDYELCPGILNSSNIVPHPDSGKLTLKKVSFSSGKSNRELLSPYVFSYGDIPNNSLKINPSYNPRDMNRFGNLQHNPGNSDIDILSPLSNVDFPYPSQNESEMVIASYAWNLTKITLPGSGTISVEYEPHHYAYTQDQRCMQMFTLEGMGATPNISSSDASLEGVFSYAKIALNSPITNTTSDPTGRTQLLYKYFNNNLDQYYYYKALVNLTVKPQNDLNTKEWISGYCKINNVALSDPQHAIIQLMPVCKGDGDDICGGNNINPIRKNAWQFMRMNRPGLCYGGTEQSGMDLESFVKANPVGQVQKQVKAFLHGFNNFASGEGFAASLDPSKSFFRLYSPNKNKIIGGSRVKRIISDDNWKQETNDNANVSKSYTTDYEYTNIEKDPATGLNDTISTGVMEYEPFNGQDENPMRQPIFIDQSIKMAPDNRLYVETPFNESLFPGSNLIYGKVKVTSNKTDFNVPGTGHQEIECFTAKDYPVKTDFTLLGDNHEKKTDFLSALAGSLLGLASFHDFITLSQGFSITLNDMHGKQKATKNYNSHGALISSEEFEYSLGSRLNLIDHKNKIYSSDKLGISTSAILDSRITEHITDVTGVNTNLDMAFMPLVPLTLVVPLPNMSHEESSIKTVVLNKINTKKGILTKKTVMENGSYVSTENLLFDDKTGFVVLSKTTNEFNDSLFKFHYPAHWIYPGLGAGYVSSDLVFNGTQASTPGNIIVPPVAYESLVVGDEIINPLPAFQSSRYWVIKKTFPNIITVALDILGVPVQANIPSTTFLIWLLHPARKNQLLQEAGSIVTLKNPISGDHVIFSEFKDTAKVINASMQEFADQRVKYCNCDTIQPPPDCSETAPTPVALAQDHQNGPLTPTPIIISSKYFMGLCSDCLASATGPWVPGSTIRFRIAVANIGNANALDCSISDQLPLNFTYAGHAKYFYGTPTSIDPNQPLYCASSPTPPVQIGNPLISPQIGSNTPVWSFPQLLFQNWTIPNYFIIDFDVLVGNNVVPGKYCNNFTFTSKGNNPPATAITSTSNNAQVTILPNASNASAIPELNPYLTGERGNWYPTTTWSFLTGRERSIDVVPPQTNIREDGVFSHFKNFWIYPKNGTKWLPSKKGWQWVETVTKKDVNGLTLETRDVLDRHNALLTGYRNKLVVAEVGNAGINEIFYDGFEDWNYLPISSSCDSSHPCVPRPLNLEAVFDSSIEISHSGKYSGKLVANAKIITFPVSDPPKVIDIPDDITGLTSIDESKLLNTTDMTNPTTHEIMVTGSNKSFNKKSLSRSTSNASPCVGKFVPQTNKKYVISAWVHDNEDNLAINFGSPSIKVDGSTFHTTGNIIDGWQRIYGEFSTPLTPTSMDLSFNGSTNPAVSTWFDDIRIFPFDAKMITHVYDGNTQKLTFTSDENNYFTKYNYDAADNLESINKETEKGVQTVKEARSANKKHP